MGNDSCVRCEEASPPKPSKNTNGDSNITFRQRRLTLNASTGEQNADKKEGASINNKTEQGTNIDEHTTNKGKNISETTVNRKSPIMYSTEFEKEVSAEQLFASTETISKNDSMNPPFKSHQVGTYSCHGIEPHPYVVYTNDEKPIDPNAISFFDRMFGTKSAAQYTSPKVVTISQRKINQDRGNVIYPFGNHDQTALFGVFDGHGECGEMLAEYTMNAVCKKLDSHPSYHHLEDVEQAFKDAFREIDDEVVKEEEFKATHSGSTACVVLLQGDNAWVANVGDSRAVSARRTNNVNSNGKSKLVAIDWSKDHNVKDEVERLRVIQSGGFITMPQEEGLPARVWIDEKCSQIGLAMSRSIGDHALKHVGVISEPKVNQFKVTDKDEVRKMNQYLIITITK